MQRMSPKRIPKPRIVGLGVLVALWVMFAVWQRAEHVHQCRLIHATLSSQGDALSTAVNNSIQSHRWFSPFVRQQLPSTLETLARSTNVIAIAVVANGNAEQAYVAGDESQIAYELPVGEHVVDDTLQLVREFQMQNDPPMPGGFSVAMEPRSTESFRSVVVLDRTENMSQFYLEARSRILIFVLGTLLLVAIGAVWQFTVRLAQSEGKTRLLTAETRHLRELGQAAAGLAHETRNPLGLIRGWTQRLVDAGLPEADQQQQAEAVIEECDRVTARINQFLAFARQSDLQIEALAMEDLVAELTTLLQSDLDAWKQSVWRSKPFRPIVTNFAKCCSIYCKMPSPLRPSTARLDFRCSRRTAVRSESKSPIRVPVPVNKLSTPCSNRTSRGVPAVRGWDYRSYDASPVRTTGTWVTGPATKTAACFGLTAFAAHQGCQMAIDWLPSPHKGFWQTLDT